MKNNTKAFVLSLMAGLIFCSVAIIGVYAFVYYVEPQYVPEVIEAQEKDKTPEVITKETPADIELPKTKKDLTQNTMGWISVPGLKIDNALVQYSNNERYLKLNEYDEYDIWGAYFLNHANSTDPNSLDKVTTIFGHSNGQATAPRFAALKLLRNPKYAKEVRTINVVFGKTNTTWRIFAAGDYPVANNYLVNNPDEDFLTWEIEEIKKFSYNAYDVEVSASDKILILSTCTSQTQQETRYIVCAKLVSVG